MSNPAPGELAPQGNTKPSDLEFPKRLEKSDLEPVPIAAGETLIVLSRHEDYVRDEDDPNAGSLTEEGASEAESSASEFFRKVMEQVPPEERDKVDVLVVASDSQYYQGGRRSMETAQATQHAAVRVLAENGISSANVLNTSTKVPKDNEGPWVMRGIREPQMFKFSPEFVDFLIEKYGKVGKEFWQAYEEDVHEAKRLELGAEGPNDIANRTAVAVMQLMNFAENYHRANPDRRLVICALSHYDTTSPFTRRDVFKMKDWRRYFLDVDYGAGLTMRVDARGQVTTRIAGRQYHVNPQHL